MPKPQYYDKQKAHEYYIKNRDLKGRKAGDLKGDAKKEGWEYSKSRLDEEKKEAVKMAGSNYQKVTAMLQISAQARRTEISEKLRVAMEKIAKGSAENKAKVAKTRAEFLAAIAAKAKTDIANLPKAPAGLSKQAAAEFAADRAEKVDKIQGKAKEERVAVAESSVAQMNDLMKKAGWYKGVAKGAAAKDSATVAVELKASVENARATYEKAKTDLLGRYESKYQSEYDSIKSMDTTKK